MSLKDWTPSPSQKQWAENYIWPLVVFVRLMTGPKLAWSWAFLFAYLIGQPFIYCVVAALIATVIGWYIWRDYDVEEET